MTLAKPDVGKMLQYIAGCDDPKLLRQLISNAKKMGVAEVASAAFRKLVSIVPNQMPGTIEHDFWCTIQAFEQVLSEERGKTIRLSRTRQKAAKVGVVNILTDFAAGRPTDGFLMLAERDMLDLAGEALIAKYPDQFTPDTVERARVRMSDFKDHSGISADAAASADALR